MQKSLQVTASIFAALAALVAEVAVSLPTIKKDQPSQIASSNINVPVCYLKTADGTILDLSNFCKEGVGNSGISNLEVNSVTPSPNQSNSVPPSPQRVNSVRPFDNPYNRSAIKKFDDELYGEDE